MDTNQDLLNRIESLEKEVFIHKQLIIALSEYIKTIPQPENLEELGRHLAIIKGFQP